MFQELSQFVREWKVRLFEAPDFEDYNIHGDSPVNLVNLYFQDSKGLARIHNSLSRHFNNQFSWFKYNSPQHLAQRIERLGHREFDIIITSSPPESILNTLMSAQLVSDRLMVCYFGNCNISSLHPLIRSCGDDRVLFEEILQVFHRFEQPVE